MQYLIVKHSHMTFVVITVLLFNLRFWMRCANLEKPLPKILKIIPHFNDTLLLLTGLWLMHITRFMPFGNADWLGVKLLLLLAYIGAGIVTVRARPRTAKFWTGYAVSMVCIAAIAYLAWFKPI